MAAIEHTTGLAAVLAAARLCQAVRDEMERGQGAGDLDKADRSPVTVADFGAQALVCRQIRAAFPRDEIVAEEDSALLRQESNQVVLARVVELVQRQVAEASAEAILDWIDLGAGQPTGRCWVLDPIDGTAGFLRGGQYAIALALIEEGRPRHAFLACPALPYAGAVGLVLVAERGAGVRVIDLGGRELGPVQASSQADPRLARLAESFDAAHTNRGLAADLASSLAITAEPARLDSQAKYALVALGQAEIYLRAPNTRSPNYRESIWDHAAGALVVEEAGGRVSDVTGRPLDWTAGRRLEHNVGVLATNGPLNERVLAALAEVESGR
jgi:HAL2 family 3'(2'),5'-bisphosphate nucleotidase